MSGPWDAPDDQNHSELDALDRYRPEDDGFTGAQEPPEPVFSVTNSAGTVTVTAYLNGEVQQVRLSPSVVSLTERELADEISAVATCASEKARAAQYGLMSALFRMQGQDFGTIREVLELRLQLPTPEKAAASEAALIARV
ncbi:YbaB/EbfC family nucleoid-associated protein [Mycolicibacterium austroafricanum]|uniref:YbaB/EbfC family nucleoid-associated protein n=1 Tax=Mycolicibacterium austroafricanum TaxID=39687 RepID=UPI001CA375C2|nr:YbaB/EbfC family nucleoid-associated protein [Mycolicibacterium austroafricanum]QZT57481.1 YbaB/EbfC family nucleoid-associated protein [Mycolicibacterium austroafricanum]